MFVLLLFCTSLVIRNPYIGRSFGDQHEWATAHTLIALEILQSEGAIQNVFRNIQTYPGENNKHIWWVTTRVMDERGIGYYTSYPPFALIFAYTIFTVLSVPFKIASIEIFNLILHGSSAVILYLIVYEMVSCKSKNIYAIIGAIYYIFLPLHLWAFHKIYSWDILWHYFWIAELYVMFNLIKKIDIHSPVTTSRLTYLLGSLNFLTIFTEYQGVYFAIGAFVFALGMSRYDKRYITIARILALSTFLSLTITFMQHVTISGVLPFLHVVYHKLFVQYGTLGMSTQVGSISSIGKYLYVYLSPLLPIIVYLIFLSFIYRNRKISFGIGIENAFVMILFLPSVLHLIFFLPDHIIHEFTLLKLSIGLSIIIPLLLSYYDTLPVSNTTLFRSILLLLVAQSIVASVAIYKREYAQQPNQNRYEILGNQIRRQLEISEVGFINDAKCLNPQLIYFTKRNLAYAESLDQVNQWLVQHNKKNGKFFSLGEGCVLESVGLVNR